MLLIYLYFRSNNKVRRISRYVSDNKSGKEGDGWVVYLGGQMVGEGKELSCSI